MRRCRIYKVDYICFLVKNEFAVHVLLLLISAGFAKAQDTTFIFYGRIVEEMNLNPVPFAHVINSNLVEGAVCDSLGYFKMRGRLNDTLSISAIGYESKNFVINKNSLHRYSEYIYLKKRLYQIEEARIVYLGTYNEFKYRVLNLKLPEETLIQDFVINSFKKSDFIKEPNHSIGSPISYLYNRFSREGKELRKIEEIKDEQKVKKLLIELDYEIIQNITGFDNHQIDNFLEFCNFSYQFLKNSTDYDIYEMIRLRCKEYKDFQRSEKKRK